MTTRKFEKNQPLRLVLIAFSAMSLVACGSLAPSAPSGPISLVAGTGADAAKACAALAVPIGTAAIGLPNGGTTIDSAVMVAASALSVAPGGPTPAARVNPETPANCKVLGRILPVDKTAPPILFQVNLPLSWNGRTVQYGGGGFNGTLISATGLIPSGRFDQASPLAQGYVTYGTDSGHQNAPGVGRKPLPRMMKPLSTSPMRPTKKCATWRWPSRNAPTAVHRTSCTSSAAVRAGAKA